MSKIMVILGPTGVGKTDISIEVAKDLNGEIISADSVQIYKRFDIGSGKITNAEMQGIKHYMIDYLEPNQEYSVGQYVNDTKNLIKEITRKNKTPIIVGGTGLYLKSLIEGYDFGQTQKDISLRQHYEEIKEKNGNEFLYNILLKKAPDVAEKLKINDTKRIIRALEICENKNEPKKTEVDDKFVVFAINMNREKLYNRINQRTDIMVKNGLENEVKQLYTDFGCQIQSMKAIGYKEFIPYFEGEQTLQATVELIKQHSRNYAKRQLTWLRGMKDIIWVDAENKTQCKNDILKEWKTNE